MKKSYRIFLGFFFFLLISLSFSSLNAKSARNIENEYFIVLKQKPAKASEVSFYQNNKLTLKRVEEKINLIGGEVLDTYLYAFVGLHVRLNSFSLMAIEDESIAFIEKNGFVELVEEETSVRSWGLDRIDQVSLPLDNLYKPSYMGKNSHNYIIDTGLRDTHEDFVGRVGDGFSAIPDDSSTEDCHGHGTHVAGTVGGLTSGVASKSIIHPVRVFACSGSTTWDIVVAGINWVIENHKKPASANLSLGGGVNETIDLAVTNAIAAGVNVVVAAGNSNRDACNYSPARVPGAITVASSDNRDKRSYFSNWGTCVDIIAPGSGIVSASASADNSYQGMSGTSMASPHIAGAVSLILGLYPSLSNKEVTELLLEKSLEGVIENPGTGTANKFLHIHGLDAIPQVAVGPDQIIRLPDNNTTIEGTAKDGDGFIVKAWWEQLSGPAGFVETKNSLGWKLSLELTDLQLGDYSFRLWAEDNDGRTAFDDINIKVIDENMPPVANAGEDKYISPSKNTFSFLDGKNSYDPDGSIKEFQWTQLSGPNDAVIAKSGIKKSKVTNLIEGSYEFSLKVTDDEGLSAEDRVFIHVAVEK